MHFCFDSEFDKIAVYNHNLSKNYTLKIQQKHGTIEDLKPNYKVKENKTTPPGSKVDHKPNYKKNIDDHFHFLFEVKQDFPYI